ncbi:hypothetical protein DICVIV_13106 [Dictyocaulus viviparus]|uniref:Uncharacterized protein n=1 Tax=Dictyocaulus viviparus TaxID=29172 RepID=A0A0D8XBA2_DICVI|nr:hypothetical protein DICVIV_13106 [Dictyocaulus viviparus]
MSQIRQPGITDLEVYLESCPEEVRQLFERECSIMLECRVCKSIFRSFVNFCSHKRCFCKTEVQGSPNDDHITRKKVSCLRRTNLARHVSRKAEVSEVPVIGENSQAISFVHTLPSARRNVVAVMDSDGKTQVHIPPVNNLSVDVSPDRVLLLQPQSYPSRWEFFYAHINRKHERIKLEHLAYRKKEADEVISKKKVKKTKMAQGATNGVIRSRSLSPDPNALLNNHEKMDDVNSHKGENINASNGNKVEIPNVDGSRPSNDHVQCLDNSNNSADDFLMGEHQSPSQLKCKKTRFSSLLSEEGKDQKQCTNNSRERRKRKIPARYRDNDLSTVGKEEVLVKVKDCCEPPSSLHGMNSEGVMQPTLCANSIQKDVTAVVRFLVSSVTESCREVRANLND